MRTLKIYPLSIFQVFNTMLLVVIILIGKLARRTQGGQGKSKEREADQQTAGLISKRTYS